MTIARPRLRAPTREGWLLVLAALGVFLAADDQTSVVAILPSMIESIGLTQDRFHEAAWIVNGYILGYVVAMPLMGRLADSLGHGRVFAAALGLFLAGSAWVALSNGLTMLVIARAVQAIGGGAVVPVAMAIVLSSAAPSRRALGLGAMAAASEAGALVGPLWGGGIAELLGWRAVFWINIPLCLPIAVAIWRLASQRPAGDLRGVDFLGVALLGLSLVCLTVALTDDPIAPRAAGVTAGLFVAAALLFVAFVLRQARAPEPVVDLSAFRRLPVSAGFLTNALSGGTLIVAMVGVPLFTNVILEDSALAGGLNLMRLSVALATAAFIGGWLAGRIGFSATTALGMLLAGIGFIGMSAWDADPGFVAFTLPLLIAGFGFGMIIAPVNAAVLNEAGESHRATTASLLTVVRLVGALVGVALLTTRGLGGFYAQAGLIPLDDPRFVDLVRDVQVDTFHETFRATAYVCFATIIPALLLQPPFWRRSTRDRDAAV